jgi:hypothetical protein
MTVTEGLAREQRAGLESCREAAISNNRGACVPRRSASYLKRYGARCALDGGFLPFSYLSVATSASGQTLLLEDNRERWIKGEGCFKKNKKVFAGVT